MLSKSAVLVLIVTEMMFAPVFGAKILFLPINMNSHVLYFSRLAADLAKLGHVTRVLAPSNARVPPFVGEVESGGNFSYATYPVDGVESFSNSRNMSAAITRLVMSQSTWEKFVVLRSVLKEVAYRCESDCVRLLDNDHVMKQVRDEGYQFAVMDPVAIQCYYAIPYSLGIPYATLYIPAVALMYRVPRFPSFVPPIGMSYTDRMGFLQRLTTFVIAQLMLSGLRFQNTTSAYVDRLAPDRPSLNRYQLMQRVYTD